MLWWFSDITGVLTLQGSSSGGNEFSWVPVVVAPVRSPGSPGTRGGCGRAGGSAGRTEPAGSGRTIGYRWFRRCEDDRAPRTLMRYRFTTFGAIAHSHPLAVRRPMPGHRGKSTVPQPTITTAA